MNNQLGLICSDMIDFCRPGHKQDYDKNLINR